MESTVKTEREKGRQIKRYKRWAGIRAARWPAAPCPSLGGEDGATEQQIGKRKIKGEIEKHTWAEVQLPVRGLSSLASAPGSPAPFGPIIAIGSDGPAGHPLPRAPAGPRWRRRPGLLPRLDQIVLCWTEIPDWDASSPWLGRNLSWSLPRSSASRTASPPWAAHASPRSLCARCTGRTPLARCLWRPSHAQTGQLGAGDRDV